MLYQVERLMPNLIRIWDASRTAMYLVMGSKRAILIDSGVGAGDLRALVESLTDLPVTVLITHGHVDHAMGCVQFDDVRMSHLDEEVYAQHSQLSERMGYMATAAQRDGDPAVIAKITEQDYLPSREFSDFAPLAPGDKFDLGGISVEVLPGAGHTPGMLTILLPELRMLLLGDACNFFTFLFEPWSSSVSAYRKQLVELKTQTAGRYDRVLISHNDGEGHMDLIDGVIAVCDDVLAGRSDDIPFSGLHVENCRIAKAMKFPEFCRADGGIGNLVYDPERLH